jgi:hypothetical protein
MKTGSGTSSKGLRTLSVNSHSIERGGTNQGTVILHTQGTNPLTTQAYIDDKPMEIRAASNSSVVGKLSSDTPLGTHQFSVTSDGVKSNSFKADVVAVTPEPIPVMHTGGTANVVLHVEGVPQNHNPMVHFNVSGAAKLASGASDVPVRNGVATIRIQGVHAGQVVVGYQLRASTLVN